MKMLKITFCSVLIFLSLTGFYAQAADTSGVISLIKPQLTSTYFTLRPDYRKCVSPICGGWFVNAVNTKTLSCPDGSIKQECYVGRDVISISGLTDEQIVQLRQAMSESRVLVQGNISARIPYGLLDINSAWISATDQKPDGVFVSISDNGIRCITYPCPSIDAQILNINSIKSLASYDLSAVNASEKQLTLAHQAVANGQGLALAGKYIEVTGPAGTAQGIAATQFYLKLEGATPKMCIVTGCSNQICSDAEVITTCEWRPEYECYRTATCTAQDNGDCGWVMDDELRRCLDNATGGVFLQ